MTRTGDDDCAHARFGQVVGGLVALHSGGIGAAQAAPAEDAVVFADHLQHRHADGARLDGQSPGQVQGGRERVLGGLVESNHGGIGVGQVIEESSPRAGGGGEIPWRKALPGEVRILLGRPEGAWIRGARRRVHVVEVSGEDEAIEVRREPAGHGHGHDRAERVANDDDAIELVRPQGAGAERLQRLVQHLRVAVDGHLAGGGPIARAGRDAIQVEGGVAGVVGQQGVAVTRRLVGEVPVHPVVQGAVDQDLQGIWRRRSDPAELAGHRIRRRSVRDEGHRQPVLLAASRGPVRGDPGGRVHQGRQEGGADHVDHAGHAGGEAHGHPPVKSAQNLGPAAGQTIEERF